MNVYTPGTTVRLEGSFQDNGAFFDPASVSFMVIGPNSQAIHALSAIKDAVGQYHADVVVADAGAWAYRIAGVTPASAAEGSFTVRESSFIA